MNYKKIDLDKFISDSGLSKTFIAEAMGIDASEISRAIKLERKSSEKYREMIIEFILNLDYKKIQTSLRNRIAKQKINC